MRCSSSSLLRSSLCSDSVSGCSMARGFPQGAFIILAGIAEPRSTEAAASLTEPGAVRVRRALLSVSDKRGISDFARGLADLGVEVVSTGGTARELQDAGIEVRGIEDFTGFPEIMDGRVKTLHPRLYAGLLAVRSDPEHVRAAAEHGIEYVDLVCVNLYPFERTAGRRGVSEAEVIEDIDIGGPTMIRAAAKNHAFVAVVVSPESYDAVLDELREADGTLSLPTRRWLAAEAFSYTARYDTAIARWFLEGGEGFPGLFVRAFEKVTDLRYGENPHQRAAYYAQVGARRHVLSQVQQHHGREISYNNILDLDAARALAAEFADPACAIVKHSNPCGVAVGRDAAGAYARALACDPLSAFGGVIALNRPVDAAAAQALSEQFVEVLFAPGYDDAALEILARKPNVRILEDTERRVAQPGEPRVTQVDGGLLVQDPDALVLDRDAMEVVTRRGPTDAEWDDLLFAWVVGRHTKSNAIVLARERATVGIGAGQMSRVDAVRIAVEKARADSLGGAVMASDAFFPFADGPALAIEAGVSAIVQPGGSVRDDEVIAAADEAGVAMVLTRRRHFRH
jgi:phosphoribosylaminoimidazolecarboxamide formyltransferase / IMP cyclohydrolase